MNFMDIINLLNQLQTEIAELQAALADGEAFAKAQYDAGFAAGVASVTAPDVQAQIDAAVAAAIEPLNNAIAALQEQVDKIPAIMQAATLAENARVMAIVSEAEVVVNEKMDKLAAAVKEAAVDFKNKLMLS